MIARQLEDRKNDVGTSMDDKVEKVKHAAARGRLDAFEEAVGITAPAQSLGTLGSELEYGNSADRFEGMLLGEVEQ